MSEVQEAKRLLHRAIDADEKNDEKSIDLYIAAAQWEFLERPEKQGQKNFERFKDYPKIWNCLNAWKIGVLIIFIF